MSLLARLNNGSISSRINIGFGMILLLLCAIAVFNGFSLRTVGATVSEIDAAATSSDRLSDFADAVADNELQVTRYLRSPGGAELTGVRRAQAGVQAQLGKLEGLGTDGTKTLKGEIAALDASVERIVAATKKRESSFSAIVSANARLSNYYTTLTTQMATAGDPASGTALRLQQAVQALTASARRYVMRPNASELDILEAARTCIRQETAELKVNPPASVSARDLTAETATTLDRLLGAVDPLTTAAKDFDLGTAEWQQVSTKIGTDAAALRGRMLALRNDKMAYASQSVTRILIVAVGVSVVVVLIGAVGSLILGRSISRPILTLNRSVQAIAEGDLAVTVEGTGRGDEVGALARALAVFKANAIARAELEAQQVSEQTDRQRRADRVDALVRGFETRIEGSLHIVTSAATELDATARSMTGVADATSSQAMASSAAAEETSANVQTVASAAEEMVASLQEIERQVQRSNEVAGDAVREADATTAAMSQLAEAAEKIGEAVTMIAGIAGQTNLLALNATIEAARAGEAGRGFAVVATEVKELAGQTARATRDISAQITAIQAASGQSLSAIQQIGRTIVSVNDITSSIAATVVEQTAATNEIARNASEAARGTQDVSMNVASVLASSGETGSAAQQVLGAAAELATQSVNVSREVEDFLSAIRAA